MKILLDVHTHTVASGHAFSTLQEMVRTAADKGLQILGITEHTNIVDYEGSLTWKKNILNFWIFAQPDFIRCVIGGNGRAEYIGCGRCYT